MITAPKNITTKNVRKGHVESVLFTKPSYNAVGEPYNSTNAIATRKQDNNAIAAAGHEKNFAPAKIPPKNYKPPFPHMTDRVNIVKNFKDEEGNVMVAPRNILTNPIK